jgi:ring-1,2-phenylacetyl-CoA epoxidase subunit PaaE
MNKYSLTIQEIRRETEDTVTLAFKQPGLRKIKYKAGQYITLLLTINGRKYARPYSFSSSPSLDSLLEITVKKIPNGIVSNYINSNLKVGDIVEILEPAGDFIFDDLNNDLNVYLWGVGSGITPLFSILKEALFRKKNQSIHLIFGNKNPESTIFFDQINKLQNEFINTFNVTFLYSKVENLIDNKGISNTRITPEIVKSLFSQNDKLNTSLHYICGPNNLKTNIQKTLIELGIPLTSIFTEEFNLVVDSKELSSVLDCNVCINNHGEKIEIFVPKGQNILHLALDNDIDIPYSCQTGSCSTCKIKLVEGQLKMVGLEKNRTDLEKNEFLLCCSYPLSSKISIEVI